MGVNAKLPTYRKSPQPCIRRAPAGSQARADGSCDMYSRNRSSTSRSIE